MENDTNKKRNKKKKAKQTKNEEAAPVVSEATGLQQNHVNHLKNSSSTTSNGTEGGDSVPPESEVIADSAKVNDTAKVDEGTHTSEHAIPEAEIKRLETERDTWLQRVVVLEERLILLENEKKSQTSVEIVLEERIKRLEIDKETTNNQDALGERVQVLEDERDCQKTKEASLKDVVAKLDEAIYGLQGQVNEIKESGSLMLQDQQLLISKIDVLEASIQRYETSRDSNSQKDTDGSEDQSSEREAKDAVLDRLMTQNEELARKVNEMQEQLSELRNARMLASAVEKPITDIKDVETQKRGLLLQSMEYDLEAAQVSALSEIPLDTITIDTGSVQAETYPIANQTLFFNQSVEDGSLANFNKQDGIHVQGEVQEATTKISEIEIEEASVAHGDVEISENVKLETDSEFDKNIGGEVDTGSSDGVSLTDAPLIGAPFRMLNFMARFVSGADLAKPKQAAG